MDARTAWGAAQKDGEIAKHYRPDVDGLRAIAVAAVVIFHAFPSILPGGFIGVDVFFVISGFLITQQIVAEQSKDQFTIRSFYYRRARRILPALVVILVSMLIIGVAFLLPGQVARLAKETAAATLFVPNFLFWSEAGYFDTAAISKPLLHLWSLGVEEQFYLIWPLLLVSLRAIRWPVSGPLLLLCAASFSYSAIAVFGHPTAAFYSPLSRLWELGIGAVVAIHGIKIRSRGLIPMLGLVAIAASAVFINSNRPFPGLLALVPTFGTAAILACGLPVLRLRPLVWLGLISYPLYLWHWPLLSLAATFDVFSALDRAMVVAASIALAAATTRFVERPIRYGFLREQGVKISLTALAGPAALAVALLVSHGEIGITPSEIAPVLAMTNYQLSKPVHDQARVYRCWLTVDSPFDKYLPECRIGDAWIWGDSYAALLGTALKKPYGQFTRNGCLPLISGNDDMCSLSNRLILAEMTSHKPKRVILYGAWAYSRDWTANNTLPTELENTIKALRDADIPVSLVGPAPIWPKMLPDLVIETWKRLGYLPDRIPINLQHVRRTEDVFRYIARATDAKFFPMVDILCNKDGCLTHTDHSRSELLSFDDGHFTIAGAAFVVPRLGLQ